jgi:hypothetical protein
MWTKFWDMHSGGSQKLNWPLIFIEAPEADAELVFYNRFGRNPHRVTCTCCGADYSVDSNESLAQLTGYHRNCAFEDGEYVEKRGKYGEHVTLDEYVKSPGVHVIYAADIKPEERTGHLPDEGYVWSGG